LLGFNDLVVSFSQLFPGGHDFLDQLLHGITTEHTFEGSPFLTSTRSPTSRDGFAGRHVNGKPVEPHLNLPSIEPLRAYVV
jgi:hypothetical protein